FLLLASRLGRGAAAGRPMLHSISLLFQRTTTSPKKHIDAKALRHADCAVSSMKNHQTEIDADDALGSAMRAFVDHSRVKGISQEDITFVLVTAAIRAALDSSTTHVATLATAVSAIGFTIVAHANSTGQPKALQS